MESSSVLIFIWTELSFFFYICVHISLNLVNGLFQSFVISVSDCFSSIFSLFRLSRSSVSSDASSSKPGSSIKERAALVTNYRKSAAVGGSNGDVPARFARGVTLATLRDKPRLCRQGAVMDEATHGQRAPVYRGGPTETAILRKAAPPVAPLPKKGVCSTCGRRETMPNLRYFWRKDEIACLTGGTRDLVPHCHRNGRAWWGGWTSEGQPPSSRILKVFNY